MLVFWGWMEKKECRWEQDAFLRNSQPVCQPLFLFTVNTLMPIILALFPSVFALGKFRNLRWSLHSTCRNFWWCIQAGLIKNTACILTRIRVESFLFKPMPTFFWSLSKNMEGLMIWTVTLDLHATILASSNSPNQWPWGHNRLSTCPAMYKSINLFTSWRKNSTVYLDIFKVLLWCLRSVRQLPDR